MSPSSSSHLEIMRSLGVMAGQAKRYLTGLQGTVQQARARIGVSLLSREDIRQIIAEQIPRMDAEQHELTLQQYDRRLKVMAEALHALQEKIAELQSSGHLNARTMSLAVSEVQNDEHFSADERNILATILKQNIVLQKPELVPSGK